MTVRAPSLWGAGVRWGPSSDPVAAFHWGDGLATEGEPVLFASIANRLCTNLSGARWKLGRSDWFGGLTENDATLTFTGPVDATERDMVMIFTGAGVQWTGYVTGVEESQTPGDGSITTTVSATDIVGIMGRTATTRLDTWTWSGMTLPQIVRYVCNISGLPGITVDTADSATPMPELDGSTMISGKTALEVVLLAERSSNAMLFLQRNGRLKGVTRDAIVATEVEVLDLSGDDSPSSWSRSRGVANVINRWRLVQPDGTVILDSSDPESIEAYGEAVYEVTDYLDDTAAHFGSGMRTALAEPRTIVTNASFPISDMAQHVLMLEPLTWISYGGDTWQVMSVEHDASPGNHWTVTITADVSQNFMAGATDPTPEDPPDVTTSTIGPLTSTKSAVVVKSSGGSYTGNGAGNYLPCGYYDGFRHRPLIDFTGWSWPAGFVRVKKATLTLRTSGQAWVAFGSRPKFYVKRVTGSWTEGSFDAAAPHQYSTANAVVWPGPDKTNVGQVLKSCNDAEDIDVVIDVTAIMQAAHDDGPFEGFMLVSANEDGSANTIEFISDDHGTAGKRPSLTIVCEVEVP